jgi:hypothetical protein
MASLALHATRQPSPQSFQAKIHTLGNIARKVPRGHSDFCNTLHTYHSKHNWILLTLTHYLDALAVSALADAPFSKCLKNLISNTESSKLHNISGASYSDVYLRGNWHYMREASHTHHSDRGKPLQPALSDPKGLGIAYIIFYITI